MYELKNGNYKVLEPPTSESISNVLDLLNSKYENKNITFVGDGIKKNSISNYLDSFNLGIAGFNKFISNNKKVLKMIFHSSSRPNFYRYIPYSTI